jgi:hypothetical protein
MEYIFYSHKHAIAAEKTANLAATGTGCSPGKMGHCS